MKLNTRQNIYDRLISKNLTQYAIYVHCPKNVILQVFEKGEKNEVHQAIVAYSLIITNYLDII